MLTRLTVLTADRIDTVDLFFELVTAILLPVEFQDLGTLKRVRRWMAKISNW